MSREDPQLKLRLTEDLKARVTAAAQANGRSVNAEITAALEEKFPAPIDDIGSMSVDELLRRRELADDDERERINKYLGVFG